jgi:hypothetical protein
LAPRARARARFRHRLTASIRSLQKRIAKDWTALYIQLIGPIPDR